MYTPLASPHAHTPGSHGSAPTSRGAAPPPPCCPCAQLLCARPGCLQTPTPQPAFCSCLPLPDAPHTPRRSSPWSSSSSSVAWSPPARAASCGGAPRTGGARAATPAGRVSRCMLFFVCVPLAHSTACTHTASGPNSDAGVATQTRVVNKCGTVEERTCYGPGVLGCVCLCCTSPLSHRV